jgi:hypothetical protein
MVKATAVIRERPRPIVHRTHGRRQGPISFHGEFWRITGRGADAKKTTRMSRAEVKIGPTVQIRNLEGAYG